MIPTSLSEIWAVVAPAVADHLWQSTLFAVIAGLLTLVLRNNQARARHWLWLAASVKFLIPCSLLFVIGSYLGPRAEIRSAPARGFYSAVQEVATVSDFLTVGFSQGQGPTVNRKAVDRGYPPIPVLLAALWLCGFVAVILVWLARWRRMSRACRDAAPLDEGREVEALRRLERRAGIRKQIEILLSRASLEPGIFGVVRPVLVWPEGISRHLENAQLEAIIAHEVWHVRRRDNLAALLHMTAEAIFWFHPLVWWLGARLIEERERACDEGVLQGGSAPQVYAESILKACEFCVASPLACVSGVTGADLKKRIVRIMTERVALKLSVRKKLLLGAAGFLAVAAPVVFGLARGKPGQASAPQTTATSPVAVTAGPAPTFEVASIKPDRSGGNNVSLFMRPGRFTATGVSTRMLIDFAYNLKSNDQLAGAPGWISSEKYDINAKEEDSFVQEMRKLPFDEGTHQVRLMVQSLLADRFKLKVSYETKELPVYALVVAKNGPKLTPSKLPPIGPIGANPRVPGAFRGVRMGRGSLDATGAPITLLVDTLSRQPEIGRVVIDRTGLKGNYDFKLQWTPDQRQAAMFKGPDGGNVNSAPPESAGPSIFTAVQEQLGLRLKPEKGPVEVLLIDHIEPPTPN